MTGNKNLNSAKSARKDEFYTQLTDIEKEMRHYRKHFVDKVVFCNCDDPFESNFFKYFVLNFNRLKLKQLICTCYAGSPIMGEQISIADLMNKKDVPQNTPYKAIVNVVYDVTGDGAVDMIDIAELFKSGENQLTELNGDGDFRSEECIELLKRSDIVVTNPPFSMFREYVSQLIEYEKKFIVIGNVNAIKYQEIFPLFKDNLIWLGASIHSGDRAFFVPDDYPLDAASCGVDEESGRKYIRVKGVRWFTNLDIRQRHDELILVRRYNETDYPKYINYNAIEVSKTADIPCDYPGLMGVPITFMDKYNPDQFEIIGSSQQLIREISDDIKEKARYSQIGCFYLDNLDGTYRKMYDRFVIRNKKPEGVK